MKGHSTKNINNNNNTSNNTLLGSFSDVTRLLAVALIGLITGAVLMHAFTKAGRGDWPSHLLSLSSTLNQASRATPPATPIQLESILHYATSAVVPQQSIHEIKVSYNVLRSLGPCNFLVFGLGYDSLMWASLNPEGTTLFLEESPQWVQTVLKDAPYLNAKTVAYRTQLHEADRLLTSYRDEPECHPRNAYLKGNRKCRLALENLPEEVYEREWDVIMIDAPRGYFREAPGRMAAIYSAAVMARKRKRVGSTHVFLHDVDRKVEKEFAKEFLCDKYRVGGNVGRLWHFEIPHGSVEENNDSGYSFC